MIRLTVEKSTRRAVSEGATGAFSAREGCAARRRRRPPAGRRCGPSPAMLRAGILRSGGIRDGVPRGRDRRPRAVAGRRPSAPAVALVRSATLRAGAVLVTRGPCRRRSWRRTASWRAPCALAAGLASLGCAGRLAGRAWRERWRRRPRRGGARRGLRRPAATGAGADDVAGSSGVTRPSSRTRPPAHLPPGCVFRITNRETFWPVRRIDGARVATPRTGRLTS